MKRTLATLFLLVALVLSCCFPAMAESAGAASFTGNQQTLFEAVKWNVDFPKNAQILQATEYLCKIDDLQMHLLLAEVTQNENIETLFGKGSRILLIDLESGEIITHTNCVWPESSDIHSKEDALNMLFSCYFSYLEGYNPFIFADHEITFPLTPEEISAINSELNHYFMPQ
ncbi:MAG: hypothetical protein E7319_06115 [Clostridiales bacterium]|nr:hypothetical protein [Clostridiales bacterium]